MIDNGYLFAKDNSRLFINTSLGCSSKCSFCYLSKMGIKNIKNKSFADVLKMLESSDYKYSKDTLITIGCFSECFDEINKKETIKMIKYFLNNGNQVQMATKRCVTFDDIKEIVHDIKYYGQFVIFVSSSAITEHDNYEAMTESVERRFKSFELLKENIPVVLYMKPVLQNVTIKDIEIYKKIIRDYNIQDVVVGTIFTEEESREQVHFSNDNKLFYNECSDEEKIVKNLSDIARVWRRSSEVLKFYKDDLNDRRN